MTVTILVALLIAFCNLILLSAMAAGRSNPGWSQRLWLGAQASLLALALIAEILIMSAIGVKGKVGGVFMVVGLALAFLPAGMLAYLEYILTGRRGRFGGDLRGSPWLGRIRVGGFLDR